MASLIPNFGLLALFWLQKETHIIGRKQSFAWILNLQVFRLELESTGTIPSTLGFEIGIIITERNINEKSFLDILRIALQKVVELTRLTAIQGYVEHILPTEEYNNIETFIKDHKPILKELGIKNEVQLVYLFTLAAVADEYKVSLKNYIEKIIQEQVVQFKSTEFTNSTPVSI
ncbi:hypothetical protein RhiirA4_472861 [Rhizophagus irregularis]|uniref:Uncharacterized protein n=1 Tax=Rhizophagus irregularis TaxID=588596 RepID=A0A2I1H5N1_9GLOM|nr:hypothetical protein RhiirA4_472861 [Rhizophagus irregularis]